MWLQIHEFQSKKKEKKINLALHVTKIKLTPKQAEENKQ
jgi:hypothetical protein